MILFKYNIKAAFFQMYFFISVRFFFFYFGKVMYVRSFTGGGASWVILFFYLLLKLMYVRSFTGGGASWVISRLTSAPAQSFFFLFR